MEYDVREGVLKVSGNVGIGDMNCPSMKVYLCCGAASPSVSDTAGITTNTPQCWFDVRDGGIR